MSIFEPTNFCDGVYWTNDGVKRKADGLSVRLTAHCDNACDFCIAAEDMKCVRPVNIPEVIKATKESGARTLQILGGEPLLFLDNCLEYIHGVKDQIEYFFFTTSLPYTLVSQWDKFCELMRLSNSLSVSLQSTDWVVNNQLLKAKKNFNRIELLEKIVNTEDFGSKVLVHLNLLKGGIDDEVKLWNALDDLNDIGVARVRINELQKAPEAYVSFEKISGVKMKSAYAHGCKTRLDNFYPGMEVLVKRSCFLVEESLTATEEDYQKLLEKDAEPERFAWQPSTVLYEDGQLEFYWLTSRDSPSPPPKPKGGPVPLGIPTLRKP